MKKALVALCFLSLLLSVNGDAAGGAIFLSVLIMGEVFVIIGLLVSVTVILYLIIMKNKDEPDSVLASHKQQAPPKPPKAPSTTINNQAAHVDQSTNWAERCSSSPMKQAPPKPPRTLSTMIDIGVPYSAMKQSPVKPQEGATRCPGIDRNASSSRVQHQKSNDNNNIQL